MILLLLRFSVEYAGSELTMWYSFGVGLAVPTAIKKLQSIQTKARNNY